MLIHTLSQGGEEGLEGCRLGEGGLVGEELQPPGLVRRAQPFEGSRAGAFIVPIPGAKSCKHLEENVRAADMVLTADDLAEIDRIVPPGAASGTRYPIGQMHRLNV